MKKAYALLLSLALVISLAGCGGGPEGSDKAISTGKQAVEVADKYLDGEYDDDEAIEKITKLDDAMDYTSDLSFTEPDRAVATCISSIWHDILMDHIDQTAESYDELVGSRNKLAELVGMKKR